MKPLNLILIIPDQLRADYLTCYGHPFVQTKNIDALAAQGVVLDRVYCAAPLCGPSRISLVTSTHLGEHNHRNYGSTISPDVPNLVCQLKQAGYATGMFGKNHCFTYSRLPEVFDGLDEICLGNYDRHPSYEHSFSAFPLEPDHEYNITERLTTELMGWIRQQDGPFFGWVNYQDPHPAFTCPEPYFSMFQADQFDLPANFAREDQTARPRRLHNWRVQSEMPLATDDDVRQAMATYCGQIRYVDDQVGRLLEMLDDTGLAENTVVCFMSDHGEFLGDFGVFHKIGVFYECLTRLPVILRHPQGQWHPGRFPGLVEEVDLTPTLLEALGQPIPATMVGRSLHRSLRGLQSWTKQSALMEAGVGAPTPQEPIPGVKHKAPFAPNSFGPGAAIRTERWKLCLYHDDTPELYDLQQDPHETTNRYDDPQLADTQRELTELLTRRMLGVKVRDVGLKWPGPGHDVRAAPLEQP